MPRRNRRATAEHPQEGRVLYGEIAEELSGPAGLEDLDDAAVERARAWAKKNRRRWPPAPTDSGFQVRVWSL